jgi:GNAT superfamily N-acetyltransferase
VEVKLHRERPIPPEQVMELYRLVGWWQDRTAGEIAFVLERDPACGVWEGDRLVGFARAVTDGRFRAYVEDVVVHPDVRRQAVGQRLVARLLEALSHIDVVSLFCQPELVPFYERNGWKPNRKQVVMHRKGV